jgi:hypothetical protein
LSRVPQVLAMLSVCVRACVRACVCVCARVCVRACVLRASPGAELSAERVSLNRAAN